MDTNIYYYKIKMYVEDINEFEEEDGYTFGTNYADALEKLIEYYGENEIENFTLEYIGDRPIIILPTEGAINKFGLREAIKNNNCF